MGVIINSPFITLNGSVTVRTQSNNKECIDVKNFHTYSGGPVDTEKGFILQMEKKSKQEPEVINISSSIKVLKNISKSSKMQKSMFLFGYCGWAAGQLEKELQNNYWLLSQANKNIIFDTNNSEKWQQALKTLSITPVQYSCYVGNC